MAYDIRQYAVTCCLIFFIIFSVKKIMLKSDTFKQLI